MNKKECILGIDLGTSSVKMILKYRDGSVVKAKESYDDKTPFGWWKAVKCALSELDLEGVLAIGLSSQVGTYVIDGTHVIEWSSKAGSSELARVKEYYEDEVFVEEISMPHPNIVSYPIPRLMYIKGHYPEAEKVCQPKDYLCEMLIGKCVSDKYSWRGLANLKTNQYSRKFMDYMGVDVHKLPELKEISEVAGYTKEIQLDGKVLSAGIPVFVGLNDFFASLLGMGICNEGDMFDVSGTSEHLGVLEKSINAHTNMVSGPYLYENVHYGVTASSGVSLDYGLSLFGYDEVCLAANLSNHPPVFLPYLNGERAPIWDAGARGMFLGIEAGCEKSDMAYAVLEGVAFSLYHIYESMGKPHVNSMRVSGGAAVNEMLNQLKAELFGIPLLIMEENDTSALGACMTAAVGAGWFEDYKQAAKQICRIKEVVNPCGLYRDILEKRFAVYKQLYPAVRQQCEEMRRI